MDALLSALEKINESFGGLEKVSEQATLATKEVGQAAESAGKAAQRGSKGIHIFGSSLMRIVKYRIIRSVIRSITSAFAEGLKNVREYSETMSGEAHRMAETLKNLSASNQIMKNQIGSAWGELLSIIMPYVQQIINAVARLADWLSQMFAAIGGHTNYYKAVDASAALAKNTAAGAASAKEMRRQLMGFDEINRLDAPNNGGGGGGGGIADSVNNMFDYTAIGENIQKIAEQIKNNLPAIMTALSGFWLALGAVLAFSGANVPLGLALMALGAVTMVKAAKMDWGTVSPMVQFALGAIAGIVGASLLAVGAVLAFSGANLPLGIGLMIAGLASVGAAAVTWNKATTEVKKQLSVLMGIIGAALIPLGIMFMFAGHFGIGLAMILAGGAMGITAIAINWNAILDKLKETWKNIKTWWNTGVGQYFKAEWWEKLFENSILAPIEKACEAIGGWVEKILGFFEQLFQPREMPIKVDMWASQWIPGGGMYASGGFPEDGFFFANHNEMVGQFSNGRTAVANNEEITEGIRRAVVEGMSAVLSGNSGTQNVNVYLDGKQITNAVTRNQRQMSRATGVAYG